MTVHTLECCSCLNAEFKHTKWVKVMGQEAGEGGMGEMWTQGGAGEKHKGIHIAIGWGDFTLSDLSKKKIIKIKQK